MIYHFKSLVLVRKGRAFYTTLYQEVFFGNPGGGRVLKFPHEFIRYRTVYLSVSILKI